jgi:hypothetical protein
LRAGVQRVCQLRLVAAPSGRDHDASADRGGVEVERNCNGDLKLLGMNLVVPSSTLGGSANHVRAETLEGKPAGAFEFAVVN